jgi:hypothetical protein
VTAFGYGKLGQLLTVAARGFCVIEVWLLAGFFAAHAVWSVEDGETLVPIYAYYKDGQRHMERVEAERLEDAVRIGQEALAANTANATSAVLIYDGYLTFDGRRSDALFVELRAYGTSPVEARLAIPYQPHSDTARFTVYKPKLIALPEDLQEQMGEFLEAFWKGVDSHEQGSKSWNAHIDQSR